jgi:hypothetical protein
MYFQLQATVDIPQAALSPVRRYLELPPGARFPSFPSIPPASSRPQKPPTIGLHYLIDRPGADEDVDDDVQCRLMPLG